MQGTAGPHAGGHDTAPSVPSRQPPCHAPCCAPILSPLACPLYFCLHVPSRGSCFPTCLYTCCCPSCLYARRLLKVCPAAPALLFDPFNCMRTVFSTSLLPTLSAMLTYSLPLLGCLMCIKPTYHIGNREKDTFVGPPATCCAQVCVSRCWASAESQRRPTGGLEL